ncbi:MAG: cation:proton antiporter subunit C [Bacillota bacterium]|nr:cation:proton antiporter subunit C [Bacillota bacterium]
MNIIILILLAIALSIVGLGTNKNLIKTIIFINLLQSNIILLFISFNYHESLVPPIFENSMENLADPMPQALMITAIVIGASITSLALMFSIKIFHHFGTLDWDIIKKRMD